MRPVVPLLGPKSGGPKPVVRGMLAGDHSHGATLCVGDVAPAKYFQLASRLSDATTTPCESRPVFRKPPWRFVATVDTVGPNTAMTPLAPKVLGTANQILFAPATSGVPVMVIVRHDFQQQLLTPASHPAEMSHAVESSATKTPLTYRFAWSSPL